MRVAVAGSDANTIAHHFGRSAIWLVFQVEDGNITGTEIRENTHTPHKGGKCNEIESKDAPHNHSEILEALKDCEAVVSAGMGWRAVRDLRRHGIQPFIADKSCAPRDAAQLCATGALELADENFCQGRH